MNGIRVEMVGGTNDGKIVTVPVDQHMRPTLDVLRLAVLAPLGISADDASDSLIDPVEIYQRRMAPSDDQVWRYDYTGTT